MLKKFEVVQGRVQESQNEHAAVMLFIQPSDEEKKSLIDNFKLDEHTMNSSLDPDELARIEFEPAHTAIISKRPKMYSAQDRFLFKVASLGMFLFQDKLIIVVSEDIGLFDNKTFWKTKSIPDIMLKVLYRCILHYLDHLKVINQISDELEVKINISMENKYLLSLFTLEKSLVYYINAINSNAVMLQKIKNSVSKIGISEEAHEFLDDLIIENNQCLKQAEIYSNILSSLMDARASIINNNISQLMKTLNLITIGIMVPTFVVSAFSMNVGIPFQKHPFAFWIVMALAFCFMIGFLIFWRFKRGKLGLKNF